MSQAEQSAAFLGRIAPQLDNHLLLQVLDFYAARGVDVVDAKKTLIGRTKRFDLTDDGSSSNPAMAELQKNFTTVKNAALPIIRKYFDEKQDEGLVLKISEQEIRDIKSKSDQLSLRTTSTTSEKVERFRDPSVDPKQFKEALLAEFGADDAKKKVEVKCVKDMRTVAGTTKTAVTEVWYVYIQEVHGELRDANFNALLDMGYLLFESGSYRDAYEVLNFCRLVMDDTHPRFIQTLWGLLATSMLAPVWGTAETVLDLIRTYVTRDIQDDELAPDRNEPPTIRTRNWMLHWSLFVYFKGGESLSGKFLDVVFDAAVRYNFREFNNLHTIETVAPHLLRYVAAACLLNRNKRSSLFHALKVVRVCFEYSDALTQLIDVLVGQANFDKVFELLPQVAAVVENDFFLRGLKSQIMDGALKLTYEFYIRTHKSVSIASVASRLYPEEMANPTTEADAKARAELWLANLIRDAKVVAKIDSVGGKVDVGSNAVSIHQRIVDKMNQIPRAQLAH